MVLTLTFLNVLIILISDLNVLSTREKDVFNHSKFQRLLIIFKLSLAELTLVRISGAAATSDRVVLKQSLCSINNRIHEFDPHSYYWEEWEILFNT